MGFYYELYPCFKSVIKSLLGFNTLEKGKGKISDSILSTATIFVLIIIFVLLSPWIFFNYMIRGYLGLVHGSNYGGLLNMDAPFEHADPKILINTVYIIEHDGSNEELYNDIKTACKKLLESHSKFSSTVRKCLGFYYFLTNQYTLEDIVSQVDYAEGSLTKEKLLDYLELHYLALPVNEHKMWEVKVFNTPILLRENSKKYYPVLIRTNHCVADGVCLSVFHQKHLMSDGEVRINQPISLEIFNSDRNNGHKMAVFVEDEPKYFDIIKKIRTHFQVTFTDVLTTAAVSSLTDYLNEKRLDPGRVLIGFTARAVTENSSAILNGDILRNEAVAQLAVIPCKTSASDSLTSQLEAVAKVLRNARHSADIQCMYHIQKFCAFIPPAIAVGLLEIVTQGVSLGITNIPYPDFGTVQGHSIKDVLLFPTRTGNPKFVMTICSYGKRLQVVLLSNEGLVTTREDLERILDGTFKNIMAIWEENKGTLENNHTTNYYFV